MHFRRSAMDVVGRCRVTAASFAAVLSPLAGIAATLMGTGPGKVDTHLLIFTEGAELQQRPQEAPKTGAADTSDTPSDSTEVRLTVQETATFRINGAVPKQRVYFAKDWSNRKYPFNPGLQANEKTMFPEVAQSSDSEGRTLIKYYAGVPCRVAQFQQDKLEIPGQAVIEVTAGSILSDGQVSPVPEGALEVDPGRGIAFSRSRRTHGDSTIRIGPVPGKQGLVIGGERSEAEVYKCNEPLEIGSYKPNLWVSAASMIPFECDQEGLPNRAIPTAIGVTWRFLKKGTEIQIGDVLLTATMDGGTVQFTKEGPLLNGVQKGKQDEQKQDEDARTHRILYQEGVDVTVAKDGKKETKRIAVYGVAGIGFSPAPLMLDRSAKLARTVIEIVDSRDSLLISEARSAVPLHMSPGPDGKLRRRFFTHAINVTWKFGKAGISFRDGDTLYISEKRGATVAFTEEGIVFDGVKTEKAGSNPP